MKTCGAKLILGDDYGDNDTSFVCFYKRGHKGDHRAYGVTNGRRWIMEWLDCRTARQKFFDWYDEAHYQWHVFWREKVWWKLRALFSKR